MKRGAEVKHRLTGKRLMIKKDYGSVASCYTKRYRELSPGSITSISVCDKKNLELTESTQLTLL